MVPDGGSLKTLLILIMSAGFFGCGVTGSSHMRGSADYVRRHRGEGLKRTIPGAEEQLASAAEENLRKAGQFIVTREPGAVFARATNVDLSYAAYFTPAAAPGQTDVEVIIASPWLNQEQIQGFQAQFFSNFLASGQQAPPAATNASAGDRLPASPRISKARPSRPDDFALVVGIEKYQSLPSADFSERDAAAAGELFRSLGVPEENVITLTGSRATRTGLAKYLEEWLPRNVSADSRVYFYYSGHGAPDPKTGDAYLVPWDGDPMFLQSSAYPLSKAYESLQKLKAKEIVVALDACFSGAGGRSVLAKGTRPLVAKVEAAVPAGSKLSVLAAASGDEVTGSLEEQGHGMFTYFLLKGLSGAADGNADGRVDLGELHGFVKTQVQRAARRQNREQTPQLRAADARLSL